MAAIKRCRRWIRKKAISLLDTVVLGDVERFPEEFKNSLEPTHLLFLNLLNPGRLLNRLRQGQVGFLYLLKRSARKSRKASSVLIRNDPTIERMSRELESTGVSVIPGYFSLDECEKIIDLYSFDSDVKNHGPTDEYYIRCLPFTKELVQILMDEKIIALMSHYQKGATFARNYPCMFYSNPATHSDDEHSLNSAMARNWHIDHSTLIQYAVLLRDTDETSTRMQVIAGTQKYHSVAKAHYSDKYISEFIESKNYEVIDCVGPAGTVYIFDSTVLHRVVQVPDRPRLLLKFEFTSGSNVLLDCNLIKDCLSWGFDLESLESYQRYALSGIFPMSLNKGWQVGHSGKLEPMRYIGI